MNQSERIRRKDELRCNVYIKQYGKIIPETRIHRTTKSLVQHAHLSAKTQKYINHCKLPEITV